MADYGLTQAKIDALELACNTFSDAVPRPHAMPSAFAKQAIKMCSYYQRNPVFAG